MAKKTFLSPCPYLPLHEYNWHSVHPYINVPNCPPLPWNPVVYCFVAGAHAITYGLILELLIQLFFTFRRYTSLYFWSLLACMVGIALFAISFDLRYFAFDVASPVVVLTNLGTFLMVGGFNLTLYSRLNVITKNKTLLRAVLASVTFVVFAGKIPVVVSQAVKTNAAEEVYRISLYLDFLFTAEIFALSTIYVVLFRKHFMRDAGSRLRGRSLFQLLIIAQILVAATDVLANILLCMDFYLPASTITPPRYAIKIKIEFVILNRLALFAQHESSPQILPYISSEDNEPSRRDDMLQRYSDPLVLDSVAAARGISFKGHLGAREKHSESSFMKRSISMPDLATDHAVGNSNLRSYRNVDAWSITDIAYLGRLVHEEVV